MQQELKPTKRKIVEKNINKRGELEIEHHPKSIELFKNIAYIDSKYGGNSFSWKSGGDGDNGEMLMYALDIYFECLDAKVKL